MRELALLFLRLGTTAFGGPAAHVAMMEHEVVEKRGWLTRDELLDLVGATNLIPGPNSTELAIHIGHRRGGWRGLIVAGTCFILPAALMVGAIAWAYVRYGALPAVAAVMRGVKPVVIAIVAVALWRLGRTAVKTPLLGVLGVAAAAAVVLGVDELVVLGAAGLLAALTKVRRVPPALALVPVPGLGPLFLAFLKIGSVLFGSGYVLLAFLRSDLVEHLHWLSESQVLDAVSVGQITPGPVFTTATFIGYLLAGGPGAVVATLGIFLPAFVFVALSGPLVPWMRKHAVAGGLLDGINVASMALMAVVTWQLGRASIVDIATAVIAAVALGALLLRVSSLWLLLAGAILGYALW